MALNGSAPHFAVGSFSSNPVQRLAKLLAEPDEKVAQEQLAGVVNDASFAAAFWRTIHWCRRGALLFPRADEVAVSFNGGKDACVVLYLWIAVTLAQAHAEEPCPQTHAIFFDSADDFDEVKAFVSWVVGSLGLRMSTIKGKSFREGMSDLVSSGMRAVVMGQRRADPWMDEVTAFSPSSAGWAPFLRVNPIIDWSYSHVWLFLRAFELPYCSLYDAGYTSLGCIRTTFRNPALRRPDGSYDAAYALKDGELERDGRGARPTDSKAPAPKPDPQKNCTLRTAAVLVIGNEILNGKVHENNAQYLCTQLKNRGVRVKSIRTVPDDVELIAAAVRCMSATWDLVFTAGGLGPTHDDVTVAGVALAFHCKLVKDNDFFNMLSGLKMNLAACHKMALVPTGSKLEWPDDGDPWPIVSIRNVYILSGMPDILRAMFERVARDGRFEGLRHWASATLRLDAEEADILNALQRTVDSFPTVEIGSYPVMEGKLSEVGSNPSGGGEAPEEVPSSDGRKCRLTLTLEALDEEQLCLARQQLINELPKGVVLDLPPTGP